MKVNYKKAQKIFGGLFLLSALVLITLILMSFMSATSHSSGSSYPPLDQPKQSNTSQAPVEPKQSPTVIQPGQIQSNSNSSSSSDSANVSSSPYPRRTTQPTPFYTPREAPVRLNAFGPAFLVITVGVSFFSTIVALLGFLIATIFAWRNAQREKEGKEIEVNQLKHQIATANVPVIKVCPLCKRTYSDASLSFCIADGALLSAPNN